jgi:hypothetical protein
LIVTHFGIKSSPHRPFCRCKHQVAFISAIVAMRKSLFAQGVIAAIVIVQAAALKKHAVHHWPVRVKSINKAVLGVSIMPLANSAFASDKSKK